MTTQLAKYSESDRLILSFTARYAAVPYCVLEKLIGRSCGQAVKKLSEPIAYDTRYMPMLKRHVKALGTGGRKHSYVQLSAAGCRKFGVSEKRAEPFGTAALNLHLAISYFCVLGEHRRHRVMREELFSHLGDDTPRANVPHVLATKEELEHPAILRVYHALSPIGTCIKHLQSLVTDLKRKPLLSRWVSDRDYGLAVLCTTRANLKAMQAAISKSGLEKQICIVTDLGPTAETISHILGGRT
jgi:hypothetical protein